MEADSETPDEIKLRIGLDDIYSFSLSQHGMPIAVKGAWTSDDSFVVYCDFIGNYGRCRIEFTFTENQVIMDYWLNDYPIREIKGRKSE